MSRQRARLLEVFREKRHYNISRERYFDMQLAATMLEEGIGTILTENTKVIDRITDHEIGQITSVQLSAG